jgi:pilus assembly protein CpaB
MKSKNMVLMAVAIGCGLVAAFLTSKLGAGGNSPDMIDVIVAKKELPIGTKLEEKDFNDILTKAPFARASLPPDVILDPEQLKGKRISRTLRAGNFFSPADVSANAGIPLPAGTFMYAIRMDVVRAAAGFVMPGAHVDILALQRNPQDASKVRSRLILKDMLVVAVDINDRRPEGGGPAIPTINSVSLAVSPSQGKLLHTAESTGGELRLLLRGEESNKVAAGEDKVEDFFEYTDQNRPQQPGVDLVQIAYVKRDIPRNTKITAENLGEYFEMRPHVAPAPYRGIKDLSDLKGRYVIMDLPQDLPVLTVALGDNELLDPPPTFVERERVVVKEVDKKTDPRWKQHIITIQQGERTDQAIYRGTNENNLKRVDGPGRAPLEPLPAESRPEPVVPVSPAPSGTKHDEPASTPKEKGGETPRERVGN